MPRPNANSAIAMRRQDLRPATKQALRLYGTGAAKTIADAARAVGMAPSSVYVAHRTLTGQELMADLEAKVEGRAVDVSKLIASLSEKAVNKMAHLMEKGGSENIQLAAAKDLLDRNPETSKTQKFQAEGFSIDEAAAKALAAVLVESAGVRSRVGDAGKRDLLAIAGGGEVAPATEKVKVETAVGAARPSGTNIAGL